MNQKLSAMLTTAIVSGLLTAQVAKAEDTTANASSNTQMSADKNSCKGQKTGDKNSCKGAKISKKKTGDKNSCKNGCGEAKDKKDQNKE